MRPTFRFPALMSLTAVLLAALALAVPSARAQSATSGTITGTVADSTGALLPGATITITDPASKAKRVVTSNNNGQYLVTDVQPGAYDITAAKTGFSTDQIAGLVISVGTQTTANFRMAVGAESTTIEVTASNADLQTMNASTGTTVDSLMVDSLPAIGRDVATFLTLQPGVTPGGNVAGTTVDQTTFQLDGGSNSSDMDGTGGVYTSSNVNSTAGGFLAGGAGGVVPMPQDSIEEFKVSTSGQTADFNNSSGSQSQIVTKRGHDKVHGSIYEYYLDNNFNANSWQNNFPGTGYTPKPSFHYSRYGAAAGGPIAPRFLGGKTYLFFNYEGFRWPNAVTYERAVPSYEFLQLGQLNYGKTNSAPGTTFDKPTLTKLDPRHVGMNTTLQNFYNTQLPVAPAGNSGSVGANGANYAGTFDQSCGALSGSICDGVNVIGYKANLKIPQTSDFIATRVDHDFGPKWHLMLSYRYYRLNNLTNNQVDIGGVLAGDKIGVPTAFTDRPQTPNFFVVGLTTNISSSLTNDFHYSYTRNNWVWKGAGAPPQIAGAGGVVEPLGESATNVLAPYNVNAQNVRTRIWNGKDHFFRDDVSKLKGNHFIQMGGQYQRNVNFHQRTDNGAGINYTPTYQIGDAGGGGNVNYSANGTPGNINCTLGLACVTASGISALAIQRQLDTYFGIVTDTQVANTYSNVGGVLSLNPAATPIGAHTTIPYYNIYATDTWHVKPTLTVNFGLSYAIEMPPTEANGNQVMWTDATGNPLRVQDYLNQRKAAAQQGTVYNPQIGFALIHNVTGGRKYPYDPYFGSISPRISASWNPSFDPSTVFRVGYGRIYGRINGDAQVLNPLLSPGLILATQCKALQSASNGGSGACTQGNTYTDTTAFRFGTGLGLDGISPITAAAPAPLKLAQPYHPGYDGPGVALASPVDPGLRPNNVDTFNFSMQHQINRKMLIEIGYIGRLIHNEYIQMNPNQIPYMMSLGGQTFKDAYVAVETALGCTVSAGLCAKSPLPTAGNLAQQPFFEAALGHPSGTPLPAYCVTDGSCTAAVVRKQIGKFRAQQVFSLWQILDNNTNGSGASGFVFGRSLMGTSTSDPTYGGAGQVTTGLSIGTGAGYGNYNGGYVTFKANNFHGITLQENLTWSKSLGLGSYNQSTSSIGAEDNFNLDQQYGRNGFDQKLIFNTFIVYQTPWFKTQRGFVGRAIGGWTISPVLTAGTGQPLQCVSNNNGQNFGGEDGSNFTDGENCIFTLPLGGGSKTHRGVTGGVDPNGVGVGTGFKLPGGGSAVNIFTDPVAAYNTVRPPILGLDAHDAGAGPISGLGYLNLDLSIKKKLIVYEKFSLEASGVFLNFMNHLDFANPSLSLQSPANFGVTRTQGNTPRQIQMGIRADF